MEKVALNRLNALIVDDDKTFLESSAQYFSRIFHEVYSTDSAIEALALLESHTPHIVITDIAMPHMDGHALAREIHRISPRTPVFFLSALDNSDESKRLGDGFIKKPLFSRDEVEKALTVIEEEMRHLIGKCAECIYMVDLEEYKYVQCGLSGDLLPKIQLPHNSQITKPCPYAMMAAGRE